MSLRVRVPVAPLVAEPRASAPMTSQYLNGHRLLLLERRGDWIRIRGPDDYEGWMHQGYLGPSPESSGDERTSLGCVVRSERGAARALPLGALLDGDEDVVSGEAIKSSGLAGRFPPRPDVMVETARRLFEGTSYLWGGVTPWGADCSGFIQTVFRLHGVSMPRDAADQSRCGSDVPAGPGQLEAGDLVFFSDEPTGRITHVAMAIGHARLMHLGLGRGGYAIEELNGGDAYTAALLARTRFARRLLR